MHKSLSKAVINQQFLTEDFLLPDMQALDELDIFESALPGEVTGHIAERDDRDEWPSNERGNWTKH